MCVHRFLKQALWPGKDHGPIPLYSLRLLVSPASCSLSWHQRYQLCWWNLLCLRLPWETTCVFVSHLLFHKLGWWLQPSAKVHSLVFQPRLADRNWETLFCFLQLPQYHVVFWLFLELWHYIFRGWVWLAKSACQWPSHAQMLWELGKLWKLKGAALRNPRAGRIVLWLGPACSWTH